MFKECLNSNSKSFLISGLKIKIFLAWSSWIDVKSTEEISISAKKRANGVPETYVCGACDNIKKRFCPSDRKEDCGSNDEKRKNCQTRPCPQWSDWSYVNTDTKKNSLCWNEFNDKQHYCFTNTNLRQRDDPSQIGKIIKFRDCQGCILFFD